MKYLLPFILTGCIAIAADQPGAKTSNSTPTTESRVAKVKQFHDSTIKHDVVLFGTLQSISESKPGASVFTFKKLTFFVYEGDFYKGAALAKRAPNNMVEVWVPVGKIVLAQQKYFCIGKSEPVPAAIQDVVGSDTVVTCEILRSAEDIGHALTDLLFGVEELQSNLDNPQ